MSKSTTTSLVSMLLFAFAVKAINVPTSKLDGNRTGATLNETALTLANVNSNTFGKVFTRPVDGDLYPQPLIVENLTIGGGTHNVVYLATAKNNVYAYDAAVATSTNAFWSVNLGPPVPASDVQCCCTDIADGWVGIIGTPVIDSSSQTIYLVARNKNADGTYHQWLHALDITSGAEKFGGPVEITASVSGSGSGSTNGIITFDPKLQNQRSGLLLQGGRIYIAWSSHNDCGNYHGWVIAYNAATLSQVAAFNDTANGTQGGIWMSGGGPVGDGTSIFLTTGNGTTDAQSGGKDYGEAFISFNSNLVVQTWFIPGSYRTMNSRDQDLGGAGVLLIPGTRLLFSGGKDGNFYLVNADNMGGFRSGGNACVQSFGDGSGSEYHAGPIPWNNGVRQFVYTWPSSTSLKAYQLTNGLFITTPVWHSTATAPKGQPGGELWVSANGTTNGIVWATVPYSGDAEHATQPGIVRAFNATTGAELWNSKQNAARDDLGSFAKNPAPVVSSGRVYVPAFSGKLVVYGLLP